MCCVQLTEPGMHVVHIAVEMALICKVGGLGDVVTALGRAVQVQGQILGVRVYKYTKPDGGHPAPVRPQRLMFIS